MLTAIALSTIVAFFASTAKAAHSHRYQVARKLAAGLAGTPLASSAYAIEADGYRYDINPYMVASIAGVESTFGAAACGGNAWGIGSCGTSFSTFTDGAAYVTQLLRTQYLDRGSRDVWSIGRTYCPPCGSTWGDKVAWFMQTRFGASPAVTYP